ncbi:hypothetical protein [Streptomyces sp. NPDC048442]|uniref:hypothetical protein n=1 Tax=Streptomyces sp. NPDC048442 TaxID=3154823 RepID=UPI00342F6A11
MVAIPVSVIGVVANFIPNPFADKPKYALSVVRGDAAEIMTDHIVEDAGDNKKKMQRLAPAVTVAVKNNGELPAVISEVRVTIKDIRRIKPCKPEGGAVLVTGTYSFRMPRDAVAGQVKTLRTTFEVEPRRADSLAVTFGEVDPFVHSSPLWLYRVSLEFREENSKDFLSVPGQFVLASTAESARAFASYSCMRQGGDAAVKDFVAGDDPEGLFMTDGVRELLEGARKRS